MARKKDINAFVADTKFMDMFAEAYLACGNVATKALLLVRPDMAQKNQNFMWNLASACIKNPYFEVALEKAKLPIWYQRLHKRLMTTATDQML